jgi:hypothetical protein
MANNTYDIVQQALERIRLFPDDAGGDKIYGRISLCGRVFHRWSFCSDRQDWTVIRLDERDVFDFPAAEKPAHLKSGAIPDACLQLPDAACFMKGR